MSISTSGTASTYVPDWPALNALYGAFTDDELRTSYRIARIQLRNAWAPIAVDRLLAAVSVIKGIAADREVSL